MMSFFSKRKDGGKSNSDSSLYPPPSVTTRRAKAKGPEALDLAQPSPSSYSAASPAAASPSGRWDGKCAHCRKLMSRCLCHEDHKASGSPPRAPSHADRNASTSRSQQADEDAGDKRHLLETLSGMHQSRTRTRVPLKMTQDRMRERRVRESQRFSNHTLLSSNTLPSPSQQGFVPTRSVVSNKPPVHEQDPSSPIDRFTRSCPEAKWRTSNAVITNTMRLAHDRDMGPPRNGGQPKNLLKYDSKKVTNRYNHAASAASAASTASSTSSSPASSSTPRTLPRTESGNLYITTPISRRRKGDDENPDFSRVWEL